MKPYGATHGNPTGESRPRSGDHQYDQSADMFVRESPLTTASRKRRIKKAARRDGKKEATT